MKPGEVVFIDQGHPDDNFYDKIIRIEMDEGGLPNIIVFKNDFSTYSTDCRPLTDEEKGI